MTRLTRRRAIMFECFRSTCLDAHCWSHSTWLQNWMHQSSY